MVRIIRITWITSRFGFDKAVHRVVSPSSNSELKFLNQSISIWKTFLIFCQKFREDSEVGIRNWRNNVVNRLNICFYYLSRVLKLNCFARFFTLSFLRRHFTLWQVYTKVRSWQKALHQFSNFFVCLFFFLFTLWQKNWAAKNDKSLLCGSVKCTY